MIVQPPSDMDDSIFIKHFNARHNNDGHIEERTSYPDELGTFRAFHRRLHEGTVTSKTDIEHTHRIGSPDQAWQDGTE